MIYQNIILFQHVYELKYRSLYLFLCFILTFFTSYEFATEIIYIFIKPLLINKIEHLIYTNITEAFFTFINVSLMSSLIIIIPFLFYQIYFFLLPGIYSYERDKLFKILIFNFISTVLSIIFCYKVLIPIAWSFFLDFDTSASNEVFKITFEGKINEYITIVRSLIIGSIICCQLPLLLFALLKFRVITVNLLTRFRPMSIIMCFLVGAMLSPPDVISQIILAIPLYIFYEISILFGLYIRNSVY